MAERISIAAAAGWCMKVVSPILSAVIKEAYTILKLNPSENLRLLDIKISQLQLLFRQGEAELFRHKETLEPLMDNLKSVLYEAEDFLDSLEYHRAQTQSLNIADEEPNFTHDVQKWVMPKVNANSEDTPPGLSKRTLRKILSKIERIVSEAHHTLKILRLLRVSNDDMPPANRTTGLAKSKVLGREKDCDLIVKRLHDTESCEKVIGIYGIAGSGKTTLAQAVYARERLSGHFDVCIWVHVPHEFNPENVFRDLVEAASGETSQVPTTSETILMEKLHEKRFLLVLDNLWCQTGDAESCERLRQILPPRSAGKKGSKILITSRTLDAALALGGQKKNCFSIPDLSEDIFLEVFKYYAFGESFSVDKDTAVFQHLAVNIAKKLKRSPLSAKTVGVQLHIRQTVDFWKRAESRELLEDTMGSLWWSYQHLREPVRRCFAFCAVFPRSHRLYRDKLIRLWVAAGLVRGSAKEDFESIANDYFDDLVSCCFLQHTVDYHEHYYVIHDLLHDLAVEVSGADVFRMEDGWEGEIPPNTRHLYVDSDNQEMLEKIRSLQHLRTLIVENPRVNLESMIDHPNLRILILPFHGFPRPDGLPSSRSKPDSFVITVPDSLCKLKYLCYFGLVKTIGSSEQIELPRELSQLYLLQVLDFGRCDSVVFRAGKGKLIFSNLRHLVNRNCQSLCLPAIGTCKSLRTLSHFPVKNEEGHSIKELQGLNDLAGSLQISGLEHIRSRDESLEAHMSRKNNVKDLTLKWLAEPQFDIYQEVLESLCPSPCLEKLKIIGYFGSSYPQWMMGEQTGPICLRELSFRWCGPLQPAPEISALVNLESLYISQCCWTGLHPSIGSLTKLKKLCISECRAMEEDLPVLPKSLEQIEISGCTKRFLVSCGTIGHPNWEKIVQIPSKHIRVPRNPELLALAEEKLVKFRLWAEGTCSRRRKRANASS